VAEEVVDHETGWLRMADRWECARVERTLVGLHGKLRRRRLQRRAAGSCSAALLLVLLFGLHVWRTPQPQPARMATSEAPQLSQLGVGEEEARVQVDTSVAQDRAQAARPRAPKRASAPKKRVSSQRNAQVLADHADELLLARQVEAARRAGAKDRARALASEYKARYPRGRHLAAVLRDGR
jgi:hypothetical protein